MMRKAVNVVIVGGGSTWTPGILHSLMKNKKRFPIKKLVLFDIDEERQRTIGEFAEVLFAEKYPELDFSFTTNEEEAYKDMDYVFCQMRTGGYPMREKDEKVPMEFGVIGQETCGPGGFAYGLRSIKDMEHMVRKVREISPDAWIINYTNPAAIVAEALNRMFPDDYKIINICDQPENLMKSYARILDYDGTFEPKYFGLNHFGWFTNLYDETGKDRMPELKKIITEEGFLPADFEQRDASWLDTYKMVQDMLIDFPEFLPNTYLQYYLYPEYKFSTLNPDFTRANEVQAGREKRVFEECKRIAQEKKLENMTVVHNDAHGDMIVNIACSIEYNLNDTFIVIVPNHGLVENVTSEAMVEVAAKVGKNGVQPFGVGKIPVFYKGLIEQQYAYECLTVDAYVERSYTKALMALTMNRTVVDARKARKVLDRLIEENGDYWPELI